VTTIHGSGRHPMQVDGHTDSIGSDAYNQSLSERRAASVKAWLVAHDGVPAATPIRGFGKTRPVAPNSKPDGSDAPDGRQKNRRVEVVIDTCH
jgi:outer membrane protein OmpA-like peptidoglycan-associated protein